MAALQPCRPRSTTTLPTLMEELVEEILLRIPPDEPAHLVRAALVCKSWRRIILSDDDTGGFLRRYRSFHRRRPPLLGFFYNDWFDDQDLYLGFMPAATAFPSLPEHYRHRAWCVVDCRHGRVLLEDSIFTNLIIWDPISDDWQQLPAHGMEHDSYCAAVLCAGAAACGAGCCDHHNCRRGGPFFVVYLGVDEGDTTTINACVYSSQARAWGTPVSFQSGTECNYFDKHRAAVIGDEIYFVVTPGARILKYDLVKRCISSFSSPSVCSEASRNSPPDVGEAPVLMENEDGSLGLASIRDSRLYLWSSRMVKNQEGVIVAEWVQDRVIDIDTILPSDKPYIRAYVMTGFAEGVGILFISTYVGRVFMFQLESGRVREITRPMNFSAAFPFISFFNPCKAIAFH